MGNPQSIRPRLAQRPLLGHPGSAPWWHSLAEKSHCTPLPAARREEQSSRGSRVNGGEEGGSAGMRNSHRTSK